MSGERVSSGGKEMWLTKSFPPCQEPGGSRLPIFGRPKARVQSAWTAHPITRPVSPLTPEGMSRLSTKRGESLSAPMAWAKSPLTVRLRPVPRSASTAASAWRMARRRSSMEWRGDVSTGSLPRISRFFRAAPWYLSLSPRMNTRGVPPEERIFRASTKPSPPLFPGPQTTTKVPPRMPVSRSSRVHAARPAFSMRSSSSIPNRVNAAESMALIWSTEVTFMIALFRFRIDGRQAGRGAYFFSVWQSPLQRQSRTRQSVMFL